MYFGMMPEASHVYKTKCLLDSSTLAGVEHNTQ